MGDSMSSIVISGDTSGTITLAAPAVAGTQSVTLPLVVSASTTNTVTNKISIVINGTTYYLLASTSGT
jgi:predicted secreted protein